MSDFIGHECGLALIRLRQPLSYYMKQYKDVAWGLRKMYLLLEKQHNRGQDGAGLASVKFDMSPGERFLLRIRSDRNNAIERIFDVILKSIDSRSPEKLAQCSDQQLKQMCEFLGEAYLGHLRYGTHSALGKANCHPLIRKNNYASRNLAIAGNFNMTNSAELFQQLVEYGLNPVGESDTQVVLERLGYLIDREHESLRRALGPSSFKGLEGRELAREISSELNLNRVFSRASEGWDGGYVFSGLLGNGDAFVCRDPAGIRPAHYLITDEVVAMASERAALSNVFDVTPEQIETVQPGHLLVIKRDGRISHEPFTPPMELRQCTFERIYFSRGNDPDIYAQRKGLGRALAPRVLDMIDHDVEHAVCSFIPNTAETAFLGLTEEIDHITRARNAETLWKKIEAGSASRDDLNSVLNGHVRSEKIAHKDQRMRTFITHDAARKDLVEHIYDTTHGVVNDDDALIVLDDSIVRGTTLRESIIKILSRLNPQRIIIVSSAPPIMYPDCYGIDMSQMGRFIAFEAAVGLLADRGDLEVLDEVERLCIAQRDIPDRKMVNHVALIYDRFTLDELSAKIAQLVTPRDLAWTGKVNVVYQSVDDMLAAMPGYTGDWYFTGRYPTPGGYRVLNTSFLNWRSADTSARAY